MKKAIVIGASSGIGKEVAKILISDGWCLGVAARRIDLLYELQELCPERVFVKAIDVCQTEAVASLQSLIQQLGGLDLFFYASGIGKQNHSLDAEIECSTVNTNALGFTQMIGEAYRYMAENASAHMAEYTGGHIAVISSIAGTKGLGAAPSYSATMPFQNTYLQALEQCANATQIDIRFTDIRPGFVDTDLLAGSVQYPLLMKPDKVARNIVKALYARKHIVIIDWRWRLITFFWKLIPDCLWRRLKVGIKKNK